MTVMSRWPAEASPEQSKYTFFLFLKRVVAHCPYYLYKIRYILLIIILSNYSSAIGTTYSKNIIICRDV